MLSPRLIRKFSASVAFCALLFAQLAVSAYACPMMLGAIGAQHDTSVVQEIPCHASQFGVDDPSNAGLCKAHCQLGHNTVAESHTPVALDFVPAFIATVAPVATLSASSDMRVSIAVEATAPILRSSPQLQDRVFRI